MIDDLFKEEKKLINKLSHSYLILGVVGESSMRKKGKVNNADLLFIHEYGSPIRKIPARPILQYTIEHTNDLVVKTYEDCIKMIYNGSKWSEVQLKLEQLAMRIESKCRKFLRSGETDLKPLKDSTIKMKGSSLPLFDTGQLAKSIVCRLIIKN